MTQTIHRIVILDAFTVNPGDLSWQSLEAYGRLTVYPRTAPEEVIDRAAKADIVLTNKVVIDDRTMAALPALKYIGVLATGVNVVDTEAARRRGITVCNVPAYSTESVVQQTFAHILNIANRVDHYARQNRQGRWISAPDFSYTDTPLVPLAGKTLGIVGLGHIGMRVAQVAMALGMDVFAYTSKPSSSLPAGIQKTTLDGLWGACDVLTLHCPLTDATRHLIREETLARMKPGVIIVNTGRGPLVDEQALAEALASGRVAGYGADVLTEEPPRKGSPLFAQENAYITPHIAWAMPDARERLIAITAANVGGYLAGRPQNVVNA